MSDNIKTSLSVVSSLTAGFKNANDSLKNNSSHNSSGSLSATSGFTVISSMISVNSQDASKSTSGVAGVMDTEQTRAQSIHNALKQTDNATVARKGR